MSAIINSVKPLVYYFKSKAYNTLDTVFKIHTKLTVYLLLICTILISSHSFTGHPIECYVEDNNKKSFVEMVCWVNGTYTLPKEIIRGRPNLTQHTLPQYQQYYQWVVTFLLVKAALFSIPQRLWKVWEHGRIQQLCGGLNADVVTPDSPNYQKEKERIVNYLKMDNSRVHGSYVFRYVACEVLNFLNVIFNMFILNVIIDQFWSRYFPAVLSIFATRSDGKTFSILSSDLFPTVAKCYYSKYGASGSLENRDALCLLTLNVVNEKVFAILYIWYVVLLFLSGCNLICRSIILLSSCIRLKMVQSLTKWTEPMSKQELKKILPNDNIGDWFIIFLLGQNLNRFAFRDLLNDLAGKKQQLNNDI